MDFEDFDIVNDGGTVDPDAGSAYGPEENPEEHHIETGHVAQLTHMYENWFLDYASYVILERAVPHILDGLKPVQRRILFAMRQIEDGRFNKVANIIGQTMQYHPHGDASIGDALVQLGQKDMLIDTQGNWGNVLTGDGAAASRYIEARLSKFALDIVFNPKTTNWKLSYDGRNREPVTLPVKFPLLLAQGVEGIAVGLASKILPHNFNELIDASIACLQGKQFELYPDFPSGGYIDVSKYNDGLRGGAVKVRARISQIDKKTLVINELPYGQTTTSMIDSILKANEKGKIKIRKIDDNTSEKVEIVIHLLPGSDPDITLDALYAFTDCETSISPNACVIRDDKPAFTGVSEILRYNTDQTMSLLKKELEIRLDELESAWHISSLEKIFIEHELYEPIKACKTEEAILTTIMEGLRPFAHLLRRDITEEDLVRLSNMPVKRISKYSSFKTDEQIRAIEAEMDEVKNHLENLVPYTINYYKYVRKKHGSDRGRKTEIRSFDTIQATEVAAANVKLYVNRAEGFIGTSLKKDEYVCDCSDIDDILVIRKNGSYIMTKVTDKQFVGKEIEYAGVFRKNDERTIYNLVYRDGNSGAAYMKRCAIYGLMRDKEYNLTQGKQGTRILYMSVNPNGEAERVKVTLKPRQRLKKREFDIDFGELAIKGRSSIGNIATRHPIHRIHLKEKGTSTLGGMKIWWDATVHRLNDDGKGIFLGEFNKKDKLVILTQSGMARLSGFELTTHFEEDLILIQKLDPEKVYTAVFYEGKQKMYFVKRFSGKSVEKAGRFYDEQPGSKLLILSENLRPRLEIRFGGRHKQSAPQVIDVEDFVTVKSYKARGKRLSNHEIASVHELEPLPPSDADGQGFSGKKGAQVIAEAESQAQGDGRDELLEIDTNLEAMKVSGTNSVSKPANKKGRRPASQVEEKPPESSTSRSTEKRPAGAAGKNPGSTEGKGLQGQNQEEQAKERTKSSQKAPGIEKEKSGDIPKSPDNEKEKPEGGQMSLF